MPKGAKRDTKFGLRPQGKRMKLVLTLSATSATTMVPRIRFYVPLDATGEVKNKHILGVGRGWARNTTKHTYCYYYHYR